MFVIFDTEYTADKGMLEDGFNGWKNREIVQIAALKVDENLDVIEELNIYAKPKINPVMGKYFTDLFGFSNEFLQEKGVSFTEAYNKFREFAGGFACYSHGWSSRPNNIADGEVMLENARTNNIYTDKDIDYRNIAGWFKKEYERRGIKIERQCSGEIATLLGCADKLEHLGLKAHNALYDVYSILAGLRFLEFSNQAD